MGQIIDMFTVLAAENTIYPDISICTILRQQFQEYCTLHQAHTSREFYQYLEDLSPDMILLDMDMPGIRCSQLASFLQRKGDSCILLLLADLDTFDPTSSEAQVSPADYLFKPYSQTEAILTLEECFHLCEKNLLAVPDCTGTDSQEDTEAVTRMLLVKKKIQQYIQENYGSIMSMQDVAQAMNYSDTHFCRLFKQCFQVNFSVYLNEFRITQAKEMLISSNKTVKEISVSCGYRDTSYFIRVFKRFTGTTPSDYRIYAETRTAKKSNKS